MNSAGKWMRNHQLTVTVSSVHGDIEHSLNVAMHRWKTGDCQLMINHFPQHYGIDGLQAAGHTMVWYGLTWSLDSYDQAVARLHRQGQG